MWPQLEKVNWHRLGSSLSTFLSAYLMHALQDYRNSMGQQDWIWGKRHINHALTQVHASSIANRHVLVSKVALRNASHWLTKVCLQVAQIMFLAASLTLAWLLDPLGAFLSAFLSRFCWALAPCSRIRSVRSRWYCMIDCVHFPWRYKKNYNEQEKNV